MKTLSFWKKSFYSALIFFGTVTALTIGYSNYISSLPTIVGSGSGLTANEWNKMVVALGVLDTNLSNLSFSGGNVGIGTVPDKKLTLRATTSVQDNFLKMYGWFNSYNNRYFQIFRGNNSTELISSGDTGYNSFAIKIRNADSADNQISLNTALFIDGNSNVGIGTSTLSDTLTVSGGITATKFTTSTAWGYVTAGVGWTQPTGTPNNDLSYRRIGSFLQFKGAMTGTSQNNWCSTVATLPSAGRPSLDMNYLPATCWTSGSNLTPCTVMIFTNGNINICSNAPYTYVSIMGSYPIE
ncbi:MAG: hypothetical protein ACD_78C00248G0002 [uncultured bacterium (gcode 4)]|uniref:Uncharacterized protein n=1 Tax=uncultured bacterium (gcode 4) TaxID=1234023 RepID=K1XX85_9BACT|nr:MAG: hypothetical protein ACD_78C00248G0002 [uncultured bacterium (gcode 4)]HBB27302.1 hypothetical protein [Candidatus Gracilibacteria bacterium]